MLRITIELVPFGIEEESKKIGEMVIANVSGSNHNAEYISAYTSDKDAGIALKTTHHDRRDSVWTLVKNVLNSREYGIDKQYLDLIVSKLQPTKES